MPVSMMLLRVCGINDCKTLTKMDLLRDELELTKCLLEESFLRVNDMYTFRPVAVTGIYRVSTHIC